MKAAGRSFLLGALAGGFLLAYAVVSHYASVLPRAGAWAVVLAVAPAALIGLGIARRAAGLATASLIALAGLGLLAWAWPRLPQNVLWMYFAQHAGINAGLGLFFGRSLLAGRQPLCSVFASLLHETMTPALVRYTRQVTVAWTLFFLVMTSVSILLFFLATAEAWSVFANLLTLPLVGLMFVAENEVRKRVLPPEDQHGILGALGAYRKAMALHGPRRSQP